MEYCSKKTSHASGPLMNAERNISFKQWTPTLKNQRRFSKLSSGLGRSNKKFKTIFFT
jgi:hypothetical protein